VILDARYERVREGGVIRSQAMFVGIGMKDLAAWLSRRQKTYSKLCDWVEKNISETLTFYHLPLGHLQALKKHQHARTLKRGD
jgi:transposase-like protein